MEQDQPKQSPTNQNLELFNMIFSNLKHNLTVMGQGVAFIDTTLNNGYNGSKFIPVGKYGDYFPKALGNDLKHQFSENSSNPYMFIVVKDYKKLENGMVDKDKPMMHVVRSKVGINDWETVINK